MKVLLVYPACPDTFFGLNHARNVTGASSMYPPLGLLTVAALLPESWSLRLVDMNVAPLTPDLLEWADIVFLGAMLAQEESALDVLDRCRAAGRTVVAGGPLFTSQPDRFPQADHLVLGEAESTLPPFLRDLERGCPARVYAPDGRPDLADTPLPRWDLIDPARYVSLAIQVSRGCPFDCEFCDIVSLFGRKWRAKPIPNVLAELDAVHRTGWRGLVLIVDDNFIGNPAAARALVGAIGEWQRARRFPFALSTQVTVHLAEDEPLMGAMAAAGFTVVELGVETPVAASLAESGKRHNLDVDLVSAVRTIHRHGMAVVGTFIAGFDADPPDVLSRQAAFVQEAGIVMPKLWLLQAFPGTRLHRRVAAEGRLRAGAIMEGTMNFAPRLDLSELGRTYRETLAYLYGAAATRARMRRFLEDYRPRALRRPAWREVRIFGRSLLQQGLMDGRHAPDYWRLLALVARRAPRALADAFVPIIFQYHVRRWLAERLPAEHERTGTTAA